MEVGRGKELAPACGKALALAYGRALVPACDMELVRVCGTLELERDGTELVCVRQRRALSVGSCCRSAGRLFRTVAGGPFLGMSGLPLGRVVPWRDVLRSDSRLRPRR